MKKGGRREDTRLALLETAEALFAESGIDAVSLRQIGGAIGSANTNVVGYHFGGKDALIAAIFEHRLTVLDARREELLAMADREGCGSDIFTLMHALWWPMFEQSNAEGRHNYAGFLAELLRSNRSFLSKAIGNNYPATFEIVERLRAMVPKGARSLFEDRLRITAMIVTAGLRTIDHLPDGAAVSSEALFDDSLQMAAAAMAAPPGGMR
jgi:AcrR family transcriptional regulator